MKYRPGLWIASAFGGHGLNTTAMAGELIARAIVESDDTWRLFLPYDLVWAGGTIGRSVMQAATWCLRTGEAVAARAKARGAGNVHGKRRSKQTWKTI